MLRTERLKFAGRGVKAVLEKHIGASNLERRSGEGLRRRLARKTSCRSESPGCSDLVQLQQRISDGSVLSRRCRHLNSIASEFEAASLWNRGQVDSSP